ncbi:hypothetical protein V498_08576 [Pseudogymnoascus sp. VKM F-4517 (FW-2822)]|nr:hypothetical protein V498_08576 [Pseudogymnoascus sp. VKM F-4517 (FW-2822)]
MPLNLEVELLQAIQENDTAAVATFLATGADPNAGLFRDDTALSAAIRIGNEEILELLLHYNPLICIQERHGNPQEPSTLRDKLLSALKSVYVLTTVICLVTWALRALTTSFPSGFLQTSLLYGSHYVWFILYYSRGGFVSTMSLQSRYLDPWTYVGILTSMSVMHNIIAFLILHILRPLSVPLPSYLQDLAIAIPLCICVDVVATAYRNILTKSSLIKPPRWSGDPSSLPEPESWRSPAERLLDSVLESDLVTEAMILKLLRAQVLASHPYDRSEVARQLLGLATDRCWPDLAKVLINSGVSVDQGVSPNAEELKWPALREAFIYAFRVSPDAKHGMAASHFEGRPIVPEYLLQHPKQVNTFIELVNSTGFRILATSESTDEWRKCQRMMDILHDGGTDILRSDDPERDTLSCLVKNECTTEVLRHALRLWVPARALSSNGERNTIAESMALYEVVNANVPNLEILRILLSAGIPLERKNREGRTPLYQAAYMNTTTDALELLFEFGADPNSCGGNGRPLILRTLDDASEEKFLCFMNHGADPNAADHSGETILQHVLQLEPGLAVLKGLVVQILLQRGATVYDSQTQSSPAFLTAAGQYNTAGWGVVIMDLLLDYIPEEQQQSHLDAALRIACRETVLKIFSIITVFYLLRRGADPRCVAVGSDSLLHIICAEYRPKDHEYRDDMRALLEQRALEINTPGREGAFPLHHAVGHGSRRDFVLLLLEYGANPNARNGKNQTLLQQLCSAKPGEYTISHSNTEVEGDTDDARHGGVRGQSQWHHIVRERMLDIKSSLQREEIFQALVERGSDIHVLDDQGRNILMLACANGDSVIAANILYCLGEEHFDETISTADLAGKTALHYAAANGDINTLKVLLFPEEILRPHKNIWRLLAMEGENHQLETESEDGDSATMECMKDEANSYAKKVANAPSFLRASVVFFDKPRRDVTLTIGNDRRRDDENLCFPNVSVASWTIYKQRGSVVRPRRLLDGRSRTPLHYAAENGNLEAVRLVLEFTDICVDIKDKEGKKAADLALGNNFYDIYSLFKNDAA